jgi:hypothetical protein
MKKNYFKPTTVVVKIQQRNIICTSPISATRQGYGSANDGVNSNEKGEDGTWNWD